MIIKPYSAFAKEDFVSADFPAVKHFFQCDEAAGTNTLSDVVGDVVINFAGLTRSTDGFAVESTSTAAQVTSGTWSAPGTKPFVLFAVGAFSAATNGVLFGSATGSNITLKGTAPAVTNSTLGAVCSATAATLVTADTIYGRAMVISAYNTLTGQALYEFNTTNTATALTATPTDNTSIGSTALTEMAALTMGANAFQLQGTSSKLYGVCFMEFTTLPADLLAGLAWMAYQWSVGNKVIYPAWRGLS